MRINLKRIYDTPTENDGIRILIDRLWPRGVLKDKAKIDHWAKDIAPSSELRKWYQHDAEKWDDFRKRYFCELKDNQTGVDELLKQMGNNTTFIFSSKETKRNNATALKEYLVSYTLKKKSVFHFT